MMVHMSTRVADIDRMPRGGPDASCVDRLLQTDRLEYLDRDSDLPADAARKRSVIRALEWTGEFFGNTEKFARIVLDEVADVADPKILELGSGHGGLSRKLLEWHPTAQLTVTDIEAASVAAIAAGDLGEHPRATVREMDATAIDAPDGAFDLAVFAFSFHHLPPALASRVFAEGTRVADKLVIIDLPRPPSPLHVLRLAVMLPFAPVVPFVHDGLISSLRTYSPSALRALAAHADPAIDVALRGGLMSPQVVVANRRRPQSR
jgi:SAM-dependent methyltransferase